MTEYKNADMFEIRGWRKNYVPQTIVFDALHNDNKTIYWGINLHCDDQENLPFWIDVRTKYDTDYISRSFLSYGDALDFVLKTAGLTMDEYENHMGTADHPVKNALRSYAQAYFKVKLRKDVDSWNKVEA
jgi:hypothetical protein